MLAVSEAIALNPVLALQILNFFNVSCMPFVPLQIYLKKEEDELGNPHVVISDETHDLGSNH